MNFFLFSANTVIEIILRDKLKIITTSHVINLVAIITCHICLTDKMRLLLWNGERGKKFILPTGGMKYMGYLIRIAPKQSQEGSYGNTSNHYLSRW